MERCGNIVRLLRLKEKGLNSISISNEQIIGKYIAKDIKDKNGDFLVKAGFDITEEQLEKIINSQLNTKIIETHINHNQLYVQINKDDLVDVSLFIKTNNIAPVAIVFPSKETA